MLCFKRFWICVVPLISNAQAGVASSANKKMEGMEGGTFYQKKVDPNEVKLEESGMNSGSDQMSAFGIINSLREMKSAINAVFDRTAYRLIEKHHYEQAELVKTFANDYLSIFGWTKGITGLAKDFVMNYFGRKDFHDRNGPLLGHVKEMAATLFSHPNNLVALEHYVRQLCRLGEQLFDKEGGMKLIFQDLKKLFEKPEIAKAFSDHQVIEDTYVMQKVFEFFSTDLHDQGSAKKRAQVDEPTDKELKEMDDDEL